GGRGRERRPQRHPRPHRGRARSLAGDGRRAARLPAGGRGRAI
ncbi:MAG: hypothetical protein AVDCRST_MAG65-1937, partial [uncultured Solirubrobacteraceae bacterium]